MIETASAANAAHCAFILRTPKRTNSTTSGSTAKIDVIPKEWETGSSTCLYTGTSLCAGTDSGCVTPARRSSFGQCQVEHLCGMHRAAASSSFDLRATRKPVGHDQ